MSKTTALRSLACLDLSGTKYLVIAAQEGGAYFRETDVAKATLEGAADDVVDASYMVHAVICFDLEAGTCRDVTGDVAQLLAERRWREYEAPTTTVEEAFYDRFRVEYPDGRSCSSFSPAREWGTLTHFGQGIAR